jgi:hypothetical protein
LPLHAMESVVFWAGGPVKAASRVSGSPQGWP